MQKGTSRQVIGIPVCSVAYATNQQAETSASSPGGLDSYAYSNSYGSSQLKQNRKGSVKSWMSKISKKANYYAKGLQEHRKISDTDKEKLSLEKKRLRAAEIEKIFRLSFSVGKKEKLVKAVPCYISTTAGPISGMLFISTEKIAFHSDQFLTVTSPEGRLAKVPYKVLIPLKRIKKIRPRRNTDKPNQKYVQIVTVDDFEFWFMGQFLSGLQVQEANSRSKALFL